jgi:hypothetical protein
LRARRGPNLRIKPTGGNTEKPPPERARKLVAVERFVPKPPAAGRAGFRSGRRIWHPVILDHARSQLGSPAPERTLLIERICISRRVVAGLRLR